MAASTREVFLLLRARDEASRVMRGFSSQLVKSSEAMRAAALRTQAATLQGEVAQRRAQAATMATVAAEKQAESALLTKRIAEARSIGTTSARIKTMEDARRTLNSEVTDLNSQIRVLDKGTSAMVAQIRQLDREASELERVSRGHRQFAQALSSTAGALQTTGIAFVGAGAAGAFFFAEAFKSFQEYQREVALTRTQIDGFQVSLKEVSDIGMHVAREVPVAFEQIQPALYDIFSSMTVSLTQSRILLDGFSRAAVAGQTDVQTAARGTIAILNGLNIPAEQVNHVLDVQFELVRKGVGTYEEFAKVFGRVIPAANRSQQSFETVAAMLAFMTRNGQSAAMAATAAARALELFTHPQAVKNLEQFNVKVQDAKGNFLPLIDILRQLRKELLKLPQAKRVEKIVEIFKGSGFNIQARRFLEQVVLGANELEDFTALLESMGKASGTMEAAYGQMADTAASKTQLLSNRWEILKIGMGEAIAPVILKVVDFFSQLLDKFNNLDPATKNMITKVLTLGAVLSGIIGSGLLFIGLLANIAAAVAAAGVELFILIGALAAVGVAFAGAAAAIATAWKKSENFRAFARGLKNDFDEARTILESFGSKIATAWNRDLWPALQNLAVAIDTYIMPAISRFRNEVWDELKPKIEEALKTIGTIWSETMTRIAQFIQTTVIPMLIDLRKWWDANKEELQPFIAVIIELGKWLAIIVGILVAGGLITALVTLVLAFQSVVTVVIFVVDLWKMWKQALLDVWKVLKDFWNWFTDFAAKLRGLFTTAKDWLFSAGENLIQGLIDGIKAKFNSIKDTIKGIAQGIKDFFQYSPAKTGPLAGRGNTYYAGQSIVQSMADGMLSNLGILRNATATVATAAAPVGQANVPGPLAPVALGASTSSALTPMNSTNVTVNVYTNELNPRVAAAELGWELAGRL